MLQAIKTNLSISTQRVSDEFDISQSSMVGYHHNLELPNSASHYQNSEKHFTQPRIILYAYVLPILAVIVKEKKEKECLFF